MSHSMTSQPLTTLEEITSRLKDLPQDRLEQVLRFVESLVQRKKIAPSHWSFDFLENFREAITGSSRDPAGMEIKVGDATCNGQTRAALWEHPPLTGSASVGYLVPIPNGLGDLKLKFSIGIRDGAQLPADRVVAFRVMVNGWKLWSAVKNSHAWEEHAVALPQLGNDVARIEFVTDGLGDHRWNWAVWGEPRLDGEKT